MIPVSLQLSGFLSYNQPVTVDFSSFDLACISGANGAGKSSLLDAITWALFGQARRRDDAIINSRAGNTAEVVFTFDYENNRYRVQRIKTVNKPTLLEFAVLDPDGKWRPLTEHSLRETEERIVQTLRMDYDTFTNASFFLQGRADQFAQQRPGDRKRILTSVLGLEVWETYRETAAERRKRQENELANIDGQLEEINAELGQEDQRRGNLRQLEGELARAGELRKSHESSLQSLRQLASAVSKQKSLVELLQAQAETARQRWQASADQLAERREELAANQSQVAAAAEIEAEYQHWQALRTEVERLDGLAASFNQFQHQRNVPVNAIQAEKARLEQELSSANAQATQTRDGQTLREIEYKRIQLEISESSTTEQAYTLWKQYRNELDGWEELAKKFHDLQSQRNAPQMAVENEKARLTQELVQLQKQGGQILATESLVAEVTGQIASATVQFDAISKKLERRQELEEIKQTLLQTQSNTSAENKRLYEDMMLMKGRIAKIRETTGANCPLCGQTLTQSHRDQLIADLEAEGKELGDRYRDNQDALKEIENSLVQVNAEMNDLRTVDADARQQQAKIASLRTKLDGYQQTLKDWDTGKTRLAEIQQSLAAEDFAGKERKVLQAIDRDLQKLNYSVDQHNLVRKQEEQARASEQKYSDLQAAKARLDILSKEIKETNKRIQESEKQIERVKRMLASEDYAQEARAELARVDAALLELGYDAAAHDALRREEQAARGSQDRLRALESARAALAPLEREIASLEKKLSAEEKEAAGAKEKYDAEAESYQAAAAALPDLDSAEEELRALRERENQVHIQVGAARQQVEALKSLRARHKTLGAQRETTTRQIAQIKMLERAFSKDGIPALLIEQALPEIEMQANEILDRLSAGGMSVRFATQRDYKDSKRDDKRETLDILISDSVGTREYEMFSGGEAFRVNFAIRLALSRVLAKRAGARLQTLVIDEGFGSQDADGRQRLIEAINLVSADFKKILVITHLEELKDAFPARIEVEKTQHGSDVRVVAS